MLRRRINFISWLWSLAVWNGLLPVVIVLLPAIVQFLLPGRRGVVEVIAVVVPVAALLLRGRDGTQRIWANQCAPGFQSFQWTVFLLGIFILFIFDAIIILMHIMPAAPFSPGELCRFAILFGVYWLLIIVAMYPGREPIRDGEF